MEQHIAQVRRFNRAFSQRIGVLSNNYLGLGRPLAESRLLFEIGAGSIDIRELRERLGLDSGYMSRLVRSLEKQGLLKTRPSRADGRVRCMALTDKGRRELDRLDELSDELAASVLKPLTTGQRSRLTAAMAEVERLLRAGDVQIEVADPGGEDARSCITAYVAELVERFDAGFDPAKGPSADPDELRPPRGVFLIGRLDGKAVACGGLKTLEPGVGEIKRMWVAPEARGLGIAQRLLGELERYAATSGFEVIRLDTNRSLVEASAMYEKSGYVEVAPYNRNPYAHKWFEKALARPPASGSSRRA